MENVLENLDTHDSYFPDFIINMTYSLLLLFQFWGNNHHIAGSSFFPRDTVSMSLIEFTSFRSSLFHEILMSLKMKKGLHRHLCRIQSMVS